MTNAVSLAQMGGVSPSWRNRIINGGMTIDQRNAGASVTPTALSYTLDRWDFQPSQASKFTIQQNAGSVTPPTGFTNYLGATVASAYSIGSGDYFILSQRIEGYNIADLAWGTANAQTVTLSFQVYSSLTGTFGGSLKNSSNNRSYPFSYTISSANTWTSISVTIAGDTSGTWSTTTSTGIRVCFGLGVGSTSSGTAGSWAAANYSSATGATSVVGTSGATFYITGVQLEVGTTATPFEFRDYGRELILCQRYYYKLKATGTDTAYFGVGFCSATTQAVIITPFPISMRTAPTALETSGTAGDYYAYANGTNTTCSAAPTFADAEIFSTRTSFVVASGLTTGQGAIGRSKTSSAYLAWSAEL